MFQKLEDLIRRWGEDRGITINGNSMTQAIKTLEETTELLDAINKGDRREMVDAVGDVVVTLIMICEIENTSLEYCMEKAWLEIKDRKGFLTKEGNFIKEDNV